MSQFLIAPALKTGCKDIDVVKEAVHTANQIQHSAIDSILDSEAVDEERYMEELAKGLSLEWLPIIPEAQKPLPIRKACGAAVALKHRVLPIALEMNGDPDELEEENEALEQTLVLATYDPFNLVARQAVAQNITFPVRWKMASRSRIHDGLRKLYGVGADTFEAILEGRDMDLNNVEDSDEANVIDENDDAEASVVKFVNQIMRDALDQGATDIHVEPLKDNLRIRYRVDGKLIDIAVPENIKALQSSVIARLKIMSRLDIAEKRLPQDGRINLSLEGRGIDVRVATVPTVEGESVSLRLLNPEKFNIEMLGMESFVLDPIMKLLSLSNGIILITGPTGSGKSTSLYSFLSHLNTPDTRIVTVEDPVENKLDGVMQIAVKSDIGLTFASALRSILRADPNIVMLGEIRDLETAEIAVRASLTGHLVFSTLHTNNALGGIGRLIDMGIEPFLLSASVRAFLAQRLVRRLCKHCKEPYTISPEERERLEIPSIHSGKAWRPVGCDKCRNTGFSGRLAIYEVAVITETMERLIPKNPSMEQLKEQALKDGFVSMREYGWYKVEQGLTTVEEIVAATATDAGGE